MAKKEHLPDIDSPIERETVDNFLVGVYSTKQKRIWRLDIRDWMNRLIESTIYCEDEKNIEKENQIEYKLLEVPEDMDNEAYLKELLKKRVEELKEQIDESEVKVE